MTTFLNEIDFEMKHIKGKENRVVDALNIKVHSIYKVQIYQVCSNIPEIIKEASIKDPEYTFPWQQTKEALLKKEKLDFKINSDTIHLQRHSLCS